MVCVKTGETGLMVTGLDFVGLALLSALNLLFKMNLVHICLLNVKLRMSHVNDVTQVCTFLYNLCITVNVCRRVWIVHSATRI